MGEFIFTLMYGGSMIIYGFIAFLFIRNMDAKGKVENQQHLSEKKEAI
ncbi:hypothetical protein [Lederbergia galactosidilytica]|nr:hypothetical protein [Lederbergia galactosidilytica]MBP1914581.1 hypothetical protein [Lederbergia galactosidilytica]